MLNSLTDPALYETGDPWPVWQKMRTQPGLVWTTEPDGPGFWSVTRYADAAHVLGAWEQFSSQPGTTLEGNRWVEDPAARKMLPLMDPPLHGIMRNYLAAEFTASHVARHAEALRTDIEAIVRRAAETGSICIDAVLGRYVPSQIALALFGTSRDDAQRFAEVIDGTLSTDEDVRALADAELLLLVQELIWEQRRDQGDNVVSRICANTSSDPRIAEEAVLLTILSLIQAGLTTTRLAINGMFAAFAESGEQWRRLREGTISMKVAIEEVLRWTSPALAVVRTASTDGTVAGTPVAAGAQLVVWLPSANRDEAAFAEADRFIPDRTDNRHLGFGNGIHRCIGMALARLELTIILQSAAKQWTELALQHQPRRLRSLVLHGADKVELAVRP